MKAIHFICRRDEDGINLNGVTPVKGKKGIYQSCCWDIPVADAEALIDGWIYLHPRKSDPSEFGGRVLSFEAGQKWKDKPHQNRINFVLEGRREARGQVWRGSDYAMAHTGGIVEALLPHEARSEY